MGKGLVYDLYKVSSQNNFKHPNIIKRNSYEQK